MLLKNRTAFEGSTNNLTATPKRLTGININIGQFGTRALAGRSGVANFLGQQNRQPRVRLPTEFRRPDEHLDSGVFSSVGPSYRDRFIAGISLRAFHCEKFIARVSLRPLHYEHFDWENWDHCVRTVSLRTLHRAKGAPLRRYSSRCLSRCAYSSFWLWPSQIDQQIQLILGETASLLFETTRNCSAQLGTL